MEELFVFTDAIAFLENNKENITAEVVANAAKQGSKDCRALKKKRSQKAGQKR